MDESNYTQLEQQKEAPLSQPQVEAPVPAPKQSTSGLAIAGLVLGIVAVLTSFLPIINNASFFIAIIGLVLAIAGFVGVRKGKHTGKGIAIAGIVLGIVSIILVLATQALFSATLNAVSDEMKAGSTLASGTSQSATGAAAGASQAAASASGASSEAAASAASSESAAQSDVDYQNLSVGEVINLKSGLSISVNSIEGGFTNYDGSEIVCVNVTYVNNGSKNASFNTFDWKAEDADGAQRSQTYYMDGQNVLNSGQLSAGGQANGNIYFDAPVAKVHYYGNMFNDSSTAAWVA